MTGTDDGFALLLTAHELGLHTEIVMLAYKDWLEWCEAEGTDPEVMTFENWLDEMRVMADQWREMEEERCSE